MAPHTFVNSYLIINHPDYYTLQIRCCLQCQLLNLNHMGKDLLPMSKPLPGTACLTMFAFLPVLTFLKFVLKLSFLKETIID